MFLPPSSEEAQLTPLPKELPKKLTEKAVFLAQSQALPVGWSVLKLSLGLSSIFNVLCGSTALAESGFQSTAPTDGVTATPSLAKLGLSANISPENNSEERTKIKGSHTQSPLWETERSSQTISPKELSFHPAPLLTDMGPLTHTRTSDEAIASNHSQHLTRQAGHQPKFSTSSTIRSAPETRQETARETLTRLRSPLDKPLLDIAKLSEQVTLSALTQPNTRHPAVAGSAEEVTIQTDISHETLIAREPIDGGLITEELAESAEAVPTEIETEIEVIPNSNEPEELEIGPDIGPDILPELLEASGNEDAEANNELGTLRVQPTRSRASEELGILRLMQTAQAPPPPPKPPISFLTGRLGFFSSENAFRSNPRIDESIYQSGLAYYLFPKLSDGTSLYAIAETNLARYDQFQSVNYNELEVQLGVRQRLLPRTYAQVGWRNQRLYSPGYRDKLFSVNYIDTMVSHRSILNSKTWVDGFYQARLGFANPETASRFRQTFTVSLNYGATRDLRTSLLYQLDFDDYTQVSRYDTYQQLLGIVSYNLTPESRISVFGGTRFGRSSSPGVNLDDTFYGAGLNVSVPLF